MKVGEVIKQLSKLDQNLDVMFQDPNANGGPFSVEKIHVEVADEDEYPEDYCMPEGYTFALLES